MLDLTRCQILDLVNSSMHSIAKRSSVTLQKDQPTRILKLFLLSSKKKEILFAGFLDYFGTVEVG